MRETMIGGRYRLDHEIGRGASGAVWRAHDTLLDRAVALKQLGHAPGSDAPDLARAEREASLAARVNHPHVVSVYDLERDGDRPWLVMELVEGRTAAEFARRGKLSARMAVSILAQVADGLAAAHAHRIVHRDVKPSNILISEGVAKLADFGVARADGDHPLTSTGLVTGSPAYLAPEVAVGERATSASDVWAFGATAYYLATGLPPYIAHSAVDVAAKIVEDAPPRLPGDHLLAALVETTLRRDPAERPAMSEVALALEVLDELEQHESLTELLAEVEREAAAEARAADVARRATETTATGTGGRHRGSHRAPRRRRPVLAAAAATVFTVAGVTGLVSRLDASDARDEAATATAEPTADALEEFARSYLQTVGSDVEAGYAMLAPAHQRTTGGLEGFRGAWGGFGDIEIEQITPDVESLSVDFVYRDADDDPASQTRTLRLERVDDGFLVAGADGA